MFGLGLQELIVILLIILLLFGGTKLPELSKSIGNAIKDLRRGFTEDLSNDKKDSAASKDNSENNPDKSGGIK